MDRTMRIVVALLAAAGILLFVGWFDAQVLHSAQVEKWITSSPARLYLALSPGYLLGAAGVLAMAILVRWSASLLVAVVYALVGASITFIGPFMVVVGGRNGSPPLLPGPLLGIVGDVWNWAGGGLVHLVPMVGAGMLLAGLAGVWLAIRRRRATA